MPLRKSATSWARGARKRDDALDAVEALPVHACVRRRRLGPRSRARTTSQRDPAAARCRAATRPSPPLLPGPQSTRIRASRPRSALASSASAVAATAAPGLLHEPLAGDAESLRPRVGAAHLLRGDRRAGPTGRPALHEVLEVEAGSRGWPRRRAAAGRRWSGRWSAAARDATSPRHVRRSRSSPPGRRMAPSARRSTSPSRTSASTAAAMLARIVAAERRRASASMLRRLDVAKAAPRCGRAASASSTRTTAAAGRARRPHRLGDHDRARASALAHQPLSGQAPQRGTRATHTVAPSSIVACVHAAGSRGSTSVSATAWSARGEASGVPSSRPDEPPDVRVDRRDRPPERDRRDSPRRVRPDARQRLAGPRRRPGTRPPCSLDDGARGPLELARPGGCSRARPTRAAPPPSRPRRRPRVSGTGHEGRPGALHAARSASAGP